MPTAPLTGLHVLVVEDDPMIGLLVEDLLIDAGCHVSGPFVTLKSALQAAETETIDIAVLDVNLGGVLSYPIGEALQARGIPFVLTSGYGDGAAPAEHPHWLTCSKPYTTETLSLALRAALNQHQET